MHAFAGGSKYVYYGNKRLWYLVLDLALMKTINIFISLHVRLIHIKAVRKIHFFFIRSHLFITIRDYARTLWWVHYEPLFCLCLCFQYCENMWSNESRQIFECLCHCLFVCFFVLFLFCLFIYFVAGHLDIKKYRLGSYNKPV